MWSSKMSPNSKMLNLWIHSYSHFSADQNNKIKKEIGNIYSKNQFSEFRLILLDHITFSGLFDKGRQTYIFKSTQERIE